LSQPEPHDSAETRRSRGPRRARDADAFAAIAFACLAAACLAVWAHRVNGATPLINDELCYLWQARVLTTGHITAEAPRHPEFVSIPPLFIRDGRRFTQYPIGFPLVLAPWVALGIPWAANIALAAASLVLLHRFVRRIDGRAVAWIAMLLTALSPFFIAQSTAFMSHPLTLALSLALLVALERRESAGGALRWAALAGATIGLAGNVSPFVAAPMALVCFERWASARNGRDRDAGRRELAAFALPIVAGAGLFALTNFATTGNPLTPAYFLRSYVRAGFGEEVGLGGYTLAQAVSHTKERLALLNEMLFGWPISSLLFTAPYAAAALARSVVRARARRGARPAESSGDRWYRTLAVLFVGTVAVYAFWYSPGTASNLGPRFLYAALPTLAIFSARGVVGLAKLSGRAFGARARLGGPLLAGALVVALVFAGTIPYLARMPALEKPRERRAVRALLDEIARRDIRDGTIFVKTNSSTKGPPLLFASQFAETARLAFARSLSPRANRAFAASRGAPPVFTATFDPRNLGWVLREGFPDSGERAVLPLN